MSDTSLSPQQLIVIDALSEGANMTGAAARAGVHRNTIANWRRNSILFREALADAQYDRALLFREKTEDRVDDALATLDAVLNDPKASASARLKAALFILNQACTPPAPRQYPPLVIEEAPPVHTTQNPPKVHKTAQPAQSPFRRQTPKVGRNELCPCGSGQKHKRCCLNKPPSQAAAA